MGGVPTMISPPDGYKPHVLLADTSHFTHHTSHSHSPESLCVYLRAVRQRTQEISERDAWELKPGGKYFFTRNMSALCAFAVGAKYQPGNGFVIVVRRCRLTSG